LTAFDINNLALLQESAPAWRVSQMDAAYKVFESLSEPTGEEEDWRYVEFDTRFLELEPVFSPGPQLQPGPFISAVKFSSGRVAIVDGAVVESSSEEANVKRFADLDSGSEIGGLIPVDHNKLAAAHRTFSTDGVVVEIPDNVEMTAPLVVEIQGVTEGSASFPHLVVRVGQNAEARVLVVYRTAVGKRLLMVPQVDLQVSDGGRVRFLAVQDVDHAATSVVHLRATLGRDSTSRIGEVGLGASLGRLDLGVNLIGDGSSSDVVGLYFGEGGQTLDYRMVINHEGRSTSSDVFLKGAVEDDAQSVFTGLLRIEKDATRTSTFETNRNLVLSDNAKAHSVPNLEILCDDVVCGHASSVGPLEEDYLYYLQSRGLTKARAERLLIRGFFQEVIDRLPIDGLEEPVADEVFRRFVTAQEEGRVS
jgi:Fe-S cluster assembly protein SufD